MRFFFWGLFLLNVAFFTWQFWFYPSQFVPEHENSDIQKYETISLYRELHSETGAVDSSSGSTRKKIIVPDAVPVRSDSPVSATRSGETGKLVVGNVVSKPSLVSKDSVDQQKLCFLLGVFSHEQNLQKAVQMLRTENIAISIETKSLEVVRYLVFIPPLPSHSEASKLTRKLKAKGIVDYQILAVAGKINAVSLGVYSNHDTAVSRLEYVRDLGFGPEIEIISRKTEGRSVRITEVKAPGEIEKILSGLLGLEKGLKVEKIPCQ